VVSISKHIMISETCPTCNTQYQPAPSKRLKTCPNCAHVEKYGETIFEKKWRAHVEKQKAKPHKKCLIPSRSANGKKKEAKIQAAKSKLKSESMDGSFTECGGCGKHFKSVDASHKVPVSQSGELAAVPANIRLLCRGCHTAWENGTVLELVKLHCFVEDMEYLAAWDWERFCNVYYRVLDCAADNPSKAVEAVLKSLTEIYKEKATP